MSNLRNFINVDGKLEIGGRLVASSEWSDVNFLKTSKDATTLLDGTIYPKIAAMYLDRPPVATLHQNIVNPSPVIDDRFGQNTSISGDGTRMAIGSPYDDTNGTNAGAIFIYVKTANVWTLEDTLTDPTVSTLFGLSFKLNYDGSRLVAGNQYSAKTGPNSGIVLIYLRTGTTWSVEAELKTPLVNGMSNTTNAFFGQVVDISDNGDVIVAGAPGSRGVPFGTSATGMNQGKAHVYVRTNTTWRLTKTTNGKIDNGYFGETVSISGDGTVIAAGSGRYSRLYPDMGILGIVYWDGQTIDDDNIAYGYEVIAPVNSRYGKFGQSAHLDRTGSRLAVYESGRSLIHMYIRNGTSWTLHQSIATGGTVSVEFSNKGDKLMIGRSGLTVETAHNAKALDIYGLVDDIWVREETIESPNPAMPDAFGYTSAISDDNSMIVIGAGGYDTTLTNVGRVYTYDLNVDASTVIIPRFDDSKRTSSFLKLK